jgi:hypothetical protein
MPDRRPRRSWAGALGRVLLHPTLYATALRTAARTARPGWWRRPPFLPMPDRAYVGFRLETQYGPRAVPSARDVVTYLEWCRDEQRRRGRR